MEIKNLVTNPKVQEAIKQEFGEDVMKEVIAQSLGGVKDLKKEIEKLNLFETLCFIKYVSDLLTAGEETLSLPLFTAATRLEDKELMQLLVHATKTNHFKTRTRQKRVSGLPKAL